MSAWRIYSSGFSASGTECVRAKTALTSATPPVCGEGERLDQITRPDTKIQNDSENEWRREASRSTGRHKKRSNPASHALRIRGSSHYPAFHSVSGPRLRQLANMAGRGVAQGFDADANEP